MVVTEEIPPGYQIPVIRGLRNLSHTYYDDQLIHDRIVMVITDMIRSDIPLLLGLPPPTFPRLYRSSL